MHRKGHRVETEMTKEDIAQAYTALMDSVHAIEQLKAKPALDDEEADTLRRNIEHVELMLAKTFWIDQDMAPVRAALE